MTKINYVTPSVKYEALQGCIDSYFKDPEESEMFQKYLYANGALDLRAPATSLKVVKA